MQGDRATAAAPPPIGRNVNRIPVTIVTGFLGSGKTTLINRALRAPSLAGALVIVNEFGAVGIDHELIERSDDAVVLLENGCLCCSVKGELVAALTRLYEQRIAGAVAAYDRVVIETSGLAEAAPLADMLHAEPSLAARYALAGIVTTVDAVNAATTLDAHDTALRQVALADRIVVTKADLLPSDVGAAALDALTRRLSALSPAADLRMADGADAGNLLLDFPEPDASPARPDPSDPVFRHHRHDTGRIRHTCLVRDEPFDPHTLQLFLEALERAAGPNLLRVKGLVNVAGRPEGPAVLHGAQRLVDRLAWLDRWPGPDRRSRIVIITMDMPGDDILELLEFTERLARRTRDARQRGVASSAESTSAER